MTAEKALRQRELQAKIRAPADHVGLEALAARFEADPDPDLSSSLLLIP